MIIRAKAFPRAGLIGNPSDGYFGKTISFTFKNFAAEVLLYETPELEILPTKRDQSSFQSIGDLANNVRQWGYYGGIRLLKATTKRFYDYARENGLQLHSGNFTVRYSSNIPEQVGLAGSSAIITACLRALMAYYQVVIPKPTQANLILSVETKELGIPAGLQDRVAQVYQGLVFMDFNQAYMTQHGYGRYEPLDPSNLPPLFIAYRDELAEGTEVFHNDIRGRFQRGEPAVVEAMKYWANLAEQVKDLLCKGDLLKIPALLNANFDKRREIYEISRGNIEMVEIARSLGASAKFCGSGGAIVGTYEDESIYQSLVERMNRKNIKVFKPIIAPPGEMIDTP